MSAGARRLNRLALSGETTPPTPPTLYPKRITMVGENTSLNYLSATWHRNEDNEYDFITTSNSTNPVNTDIVEIIGTSSLPIQHIAIQQDSSGNWWLAYVAKKAVFGTSYSNVPGIQIFKRPSGSQQWQEVDFLAGGQAEAVCWNHNATVLAYVRYQATADVAIWTRSGDVFTNSENLDTGVTFRGTALAFNPDSTILIACSSLTSFVFAWSISGGTYTSITPPTSSINTINVVWNHDGSSVMFAGGASNNGRIFNVSGTTFTEITSGSGLNVTSLRAIKFNHDNTSLALTYNATPRLRIYNRSGNTFTEITGLPTIAAHTYYGLDWNSDGSKIAFGGGTATVPFINVWTRSGDTFTSQTIETPWNQSQFLKFETTDKIIAGLNGRPYIHTYTLSSGTWSKDDNKDPIPPVTTTPNQFARHADYSADGSMIAYGLHLTPWIKVLSVSGDTYTDNYTISGSTLAASVIRLRWSPDSNYLATASGNNLGLFSKSGTTITQESQTNINSTVVRDMAWHPNGNYLAVITGSTSGLKIYSRSGSTLTEVTGLPTLPANTPQQVIWNTAGTLLLVGFSDSNMFRIYKWNGSTTLTALTNPVEATTTGNTAQWIPNTNKFYTTRLSSRREYLVDTSTDIIDVQATTTSNLRPVVYSPVHNSTGEYVILPDVVYRTITIGEYTASNVAITLASIQFPNQGFANATNPFVTIWEDPADLPE
jgi:hypothetical protein